MHPSRRHREQRLRELFDRILDDRGDTPFDDDTTDYEPDGYSQAEIDRRSDEAADRYEREMDARWER